MTLANTVDIEQIVFQPTRPPWGVTIFIYSVGVPGLVSTHTPPWGVTAPPHCSERDSEVSTHTPPWGVT